jgi:cellulose synthase/poly-beta-1,6-N-acetylglucosamine synthase-like glycosyltransferase
MDIVELGKMLFYICMTPLIFYSLKYYSLTIASIFMKEKKEKAPVKGQLPSVSIHIPVYNDPVVVNCVKSCLKFDYPKDKYEIIVVDDSNDDTTSKALDELKKTEDFRVIRRESRRGFKAGALNDALKESSGDVIVIFDSDYQMETDYLKRVVQPFLEDGSVSFVQTRWGYLNPRKSVMSRIAMMSYNAFHRCSMPVKEKLGTSIFCGTGGAIKKDVIMSAGAWNESSIGEDIDLTIRILCKGYKQVYLPYVKARGEVPETFKAYMKQQQRWAYGTTKAAKDYLGKIMSSEILTKKQKIDMFFLTTGFMVFPFILGVTISTFMTFSPLLNLELLVPSLDPRNMWIGINTLTQNFLNSDGIILLILSSGYMFQCFVALAKDRKFKDLLVLPVVFFVGLVLQVTNTIGVIKALLGMKHGFYKTPKMFYRVE